MNTLNTRSSMLLSTVHKDLQKVFMEAIKEAPHDFVITEGLRSKERQAELVKQKKSTTMNSRHLTGHAVDVAIVKAGVAVWDFDLYVELADHIKRIAKDLEIPIVWGGNWRTFRDGPHFELDRKVYP